MAMDRRAPGRTSKSAMRVRRASTHSGQPPWLSLKPQRRQRSSGTRSLSRGGSRFNDGTDCCWPGRPTIFARASCINCKRMVVRTKSFQPHPWIGIEQKLNHFFPILCFPPLRLCAAPNLGQRAPLRARGLVTYYVLFFLHLETRRITIAGITRHPDGEWMEQIARTATQESLGYLNRCPMRSHDRDKKFCAPKRQRTTGSASVKGHLLKENGVSDRDNELEAEAELKVEAPVIGAAAAQSQAAVLAEERRGQVAARCGPIGVVKDVFRGRAEL